MQKEKQLQQPVKLVVLDVKNVKRPVQMVRSQSQISVHTLIMKNVQTVVRAKKHVQDT